jgi:hypothetical protein
MSVERNINSIDLSHIENEIEQLQNIYDIQGSQSAMPEAKLSLPFQV